MSKLTRPGPWQLRYLIVDKEVDVLSFLTSNGVGKVVTIEPGIQPAKQIWFALPVEGKNDYYRIVQDPGSEFPPGLAQVANSNKVILSEQPGEWFLQYVPINLANGNVYEVHPPPKVIGIHQLLGKEGNEAVVETFPVIPGNKNPAWQFLVPLAE